MSPRATSGARYPGVPVILRTAQVKKRKQDCRIVTFLCAVILQFEKDHRSFKGIFCLSAKEACTKLLALARVEPKTSARVTGALHYQMNLHWSSLVYWVYVFPGKQ